jgi:hypothetical protein
MAVEKEAAMMYPEPLYYADHLNAHCRLYGIPTANLLPEHLVTSVKKIHSLVVQDALLDVFFQAASLSGRIREPDAHYFMRFGVTRRLGMVWHAYRNITAIAYVERRNPLEGEEARKVTRDLNVIYLNIRGILDNLAASLMHSFSPEKIKPLTDLRSVGLFLRGVVTNSIFSSIAGEIKKHDEWDRDLKDRRDPAAHRIPLAVVPTQFTPEQVHRYRELEAEIATARARRDFADAESMLDQQSQLGLFEPIFAHDPKHGVFEIYPVVPNDLAHLVELSNVVYGFFDSASTS